MMKMLTASTLLGPSFAPAMMDTAEMVLIAQVSTSVLCILVVLLELYVT